MSQFHTPVLLNESIDFLDVKKDSWYIDCNLGGGGHTSKILELGGKVIGIDLDEDAIKEVARNYELRIKNYEKGIYAESEKLILVQENFVNLTSVFERSEATKQSLIHGVLFDLGLSSHQLATPERGFSFMEDAPLDMRMNIKSGATAADLVNGLYEKELAELFFKLGEEIFSRQIAKKIAEYRKTKPIQTTHELASIVQSAKRRKHGDIHPATLVFQALRIAVNDELNALKEALPQAIDILSPGGRLVVISFHSLEDRIVKNTFKNYEHKGQVEILTVKPLSATEEEISQNPRSRSAKLRALEKL